MGLFTVNVERDAKIMIVRYARTDEEAYKYPSSKPNGKAGDPLSLILPFFPSSLSESKDVNYESVSIPGHNLPVYVWTSSGERGVSFSVYLAQEMRKNEISGDFLNILGEPEKALKEDGVYNRNIARIVDWLRQCMEPMYVREVVDDYEMMRAIAPPELQIGLIRGGETISLLKAVGGYFGIKLPTAGFKMSFLDFGEGIGSPMKCIMNSFSVEWIAFFPDGTPRLAKVDLGFVEVGGKMG